MHAFLEHKPANFVESLLDYAGSAIPDFRGQVRGASEAEIATYVRYAGFGAHRPMGAAHLEYLRAMGERNGGLTTPGRIDARLSEILEYYEDPSENLSPVDGTPLDMTRFPVIGLQEMSGPYCLDPREGQPYAVWDGDADRICDFVAASFEHFIAKQALHYCESRRRPSRAFSTTGITLRRTCGDVESPWEWVKWHVREAGLAAGLRPSWIEDQRMFTMGNERRIMLLSEAARGGFLLYVYEASPATHDDMEKLAVKLGATGRELHPAGHPWNG